MLSKAKQNNKTRLTENKKQNTSVMQHKKNTTREKK